VLEDEVGYPYNVIPKEMMNWCTGGGFGTASQCGSITASCSFVNMVCDNNTAKKIILDIFNWYEQTSLPTPTAQKMANEKLFTVEKYKTNEIFIPTIANSPLCHISVERFCKANGVSSGSKERAERCARLTSDISYFTAVQLNKHVDSTYESEYAMSAAATSCRECHAKGKEMDQGGWSRGKMDCQPCHSTDHINVSEDHYVGFKKKVIDY
jgi:hypothetical protein